MYATTFWLIHTDETNLPSTHEDDTFSIM